MINAVLAMICFGAAIGGAAAAIAIWVNTQ